VSIGLKLALLGAGVSRSSDSVEPSRAIARRRGAKRGRARRCGPWIADPSAAARAPVRLGWIPGGPLGSLYSLRRGLRRDSGQATWPRSPRSLCSPRRTYTVLAFDGAANGDLMRSTRSAVLRADSSHRIRHSREARLLGAVWLAALAVAVWLVLKDAHRESATVRGPAARCAQRLRRRATGCLGWIERTTKPGEPILLAPQMLAIRISGRATRARGLAAPGVCWWRRDAEPVRTEGAGFAWRDRRRTFTQYGHRVRRFVDEASRVDPPELPACGHVHEGSDPSPRISRSEKKQ